MITATGTHTGMIGTEAKAMNMAMDTTSNNIRTHSTNAAAHVE